MWNVKLNYSQRELGFCRCASEHGMYTRGTMTMVSVYIDDLIIIDAKLVDVDAFKEQMRRLFQRCRPPVVLPQARSQARAEMPSC